MNTKICSMCKVEKDVSEFSRKKKAPDGLQYECKECRSRYTRKHYQRNKAAYIKRAKKSRKKYIERNLEFIVPYLSEHPCVDCGEGRLPVLDFDHVKGEKLGAISTMIYQGTPLDILKKEVEKCEVRCANCHRMRHAEENGTYRSLV